MWNIEIKPNYEQMATSKTGLKHQASLKYFRLSLAMHG